jgi:hypothetical protein
MFKFNQSIFFTWLFGLLVFFMPIIPSTAFSQDEQADQGPIKDNSFLIEEAYNQEQGVIQHIFNLVPTWKSGPGACTTTNFLFTQEWPVFGQKHQISYSIPLNRFDYESPYGADAGGLGDIFLNYRYQALNDEKGDFVAFAPRFSLIFPSGDADKVLGFGKQGYQVAFPVSKYTKHWGFNFDAGLTQVPGVTAGVDPELNFEGRTLSGYYFGGSAIYLLHPKFNLMLEQLNTWGDNLTFEGDKSTQFISVISPGFRWAPFTTDDIQWVLGLGLPIGLSSDAPNIGVFFYMSFEHRFMKKRD